MKRFPVDVKPPRDMAGVAVVVVVSAEPIFPVETLEPGVAAVTLVAGIGPCPSVVAVWAKRLSYPVMSGTAPANPRFSPLMIKSIILKRASSAQRRSSSVLEAMIIFRSSGCDEYVARMVSKSAL